MLLLLSMSVATTLDELSTLHEFSTITVHQQAQEISMIDYLWERRDLIEHLYDNYDRIRVQAMQKTKPVLSSLDDVLQRHGL